GERSDTPYSTELCGGTHVRALGDIGLFKLLSEGAVASGIRRVEALTGEAARLYLSARDDALKAVAAMLKVTPDDVPARVAAMADALKKAERELAEAKKALALGGGSAGGGAVAEDIGGTALLAQIVDGLDPKELRGTADDMRKTLGSGVAVLIAVNDGRASVAISVSDDKLDSANAVDLVKAAVAALGGQGGGGRPNMAQGGGPDGGAAEAAVAAIRAALAV
ncbi:MAG: DHHA1 domain-containing protein, partial [Sphingopyxis sp.]